MRNLMKIIAVLLIFVGAASTNVQAQKFGHIDLQALIQIMPERTTAETAFNGFQTELEEVLGEMQKSYQTVLAEFQNLPTDASDIKKTAKLEELQQVEQRITSYQQNAQVQLQQKQGELLQPVFDKAEKAIEEVAKEKGLIYVFDVGTKVVLYKSNESVDVLPLVKTKLGIQ